MNDTEELLGTRPGIIPADPLTQRPKLGLVRQGKLIGRRLPDQSTLAMLKSHIVQSGGSVVGQILHTIMLHDIEIAALMPVYLSDGLIHALYQEHAGRPYFTGLVESVNDGVIVMALRGPNVIRRWRDLLGATNSMQAKSDTLRARYGSRTVMANNVAHGSDSLPAARRELALFYPQQIQLWASA
jgi:nucleoside-diphosphate kinase